MSEKFYVGQNLVDFRDIKPSKPISKVTLMYDDENGFSAGDDTGLELVANCYFATQSLADRALAMLSGHQYHAYSGTSTDLDPAAELGDGVTLGGVYSVISRIKDDGFGFPDLEAPGEEELEEEFPHPGFLTQEIKNKVTLGASYYGKRITRANGLEITKTAADGTERSRVTLNSDLLAFYNDDGREALYFDAAAGKFKFTGLLNVSDNFVVDANGNVTINGNINLSGGSITWGKNEPESGITSQEAKTIITEELVSSPNIAGGKFLDLSQKSWLEMGIAGSSTAYLNHYTSTYGSSPVCVMGYTKGIYSGWVIAPFGKYALEFQNRGDSYPYTYAYGDWDFSQADITGISNLANTGDISLSAARGAIAIRLDSNNNRINIWVDGKTWYIDATGFHD